MNSSKTLPSDARFQWALSIGVVTALVMALVALMRQTPAVPPDNSVPVEDPVRKAPATPFVAQPRPFRLQTMQVTLLPGQSTEILAAMQPDDTVVFLWVSIGGAVNVDMHGDGAPYEGDPGSYHKGRHEDQGYGSFKAPFEGSHGWHWTNPNERPVTIGVTLSGFFDDLYSIDPETEEPPSHDENPPKLCCYQPEDGDPLRT